MSTHIPTERLALVWRSMNMETSYRSPSSSAESTDSSEMGAFVGRNPETGRTGNRAACCHSTKLTVEAAAAGGGAGADIAARVFRCGVLLAAAGTE